MAHVAELELMLRQRRLQLRDARRGAAVMERRAVVGLDDVRADDALRPLVA
jgi:hypothetical protein